MARKHKGCVIAGGPAVDLLGAEWAETPGGCLYDTLSMHNPLATFTTKGCPNSCPFCAVPRIEGAFRELPSWKPAPMVCDNNILAASKRHFSRVIDSLIDFPKVDFNQGLDVRLLTQWHLGQLQRLQSVKLRFAFDSLGIEGKVADTIKAAHNAGFHNMAVYVLIGFRDNPDKARHKLETVATWGDTLPVPMRYQPLDTLVKNSYLPNSWTEYEMQRMQRYFWNLRRVRNIPYEEFDGRGQKDDMPLFSIINQM